MSTSSTEDSGEKEVGEAVVSSSVWNPELRRIMAGAAGLGALETAFLTFEKLGGAGNAMSSALCEAAGGSCGSVLSGPYSVVPGTTIPLAGLGCGAYALAAVLAMAPTLVKADDDDTNNRIALLCLTTAMGTFSVFLMTLLYGVLHQSCLYCLASASFSFTLASCSWLGGCLPNNSKRVLALQSSVASFLATTVLATVLFVNVQDSVASNPDLEGPQSPPSITTTSSKEALKVGTQLKSLNAKMYGAYWCSHCYDQKQSLGLPAFKESVQYVECSKEGVDSQAKLCKERDVPGYPTWEIGGELFPGEQDLFELQEIIDKQMAAAVKK